MNNVAVPPAQSRNAALVAFDYGIKTAAEKSLVLRDLILQVDTNTTELQELKSALETWTFASWTSNAQARTAFLDKYSIAHPNDLAYFPAPPGGSGPIYASYPPIDRSLTSSTDEAIRFSAWFDPPHTSYKFSDGIYVRKDDAGTASTDDGGGAITIANFYKVSDPAKDWKPFFNAPTQAEFDKIKSGLEAAAQKRTQIGASQQAFVQQVLADKTNAETFGSTVLQHWASIMREIFSRLS